MLSAQVSQLQTKQHIYNPNSDTPYLQMDVGKVMAMLSMKMRKRNRSSVLERSGVLLRRKDTLNRTCRAREGHFADITHYHLQLA